VETVLLRYHDEEAAALAYDRLGDDSLDQPPVPDHELLLLPCELVVDAFRQEHREYVLAPVLPALRLLRQLPYTAKAQQVRGLVPVKVGVVLRQQVQPYDPVLPVRYYGRAVPGREYLLVHLHKVPGLGLRL